MDYKKYSGYNENDTHFDDYHRKKGMMTNRDFFSSNAKGGFYEGAEWEGEDWVPNAESRERQARIDAENCEECGCMSCVCW